MTYQLPNFDKKQRCFRFQEKVERVDLGRCHAYWTLEDGRPCISEHTVDRNDAVFETYFFERLSDEHQDPATLFSKVKTGHNDYEHDPEIVISSSALCDDNSMPVWAVDVLIAKRQKLFCKRPPFFKFYGDWQLPILPWDVMTLYQQAQYAGIEYLIIEGETGSASWRDSDTYKLVPAKDTETLKAKLSALPNKMPLDDYSKFNMGIIDASDLNQPFNEGVCSPAQQWLKGLHSNDR